LITMSDSEIMHTISKLLGNGKAAVLCTLIEKEGSGPRNIGAKMLIDSEGNILGSIGGGEMERRLLKEAEELLKTRRPKILTFTMGVEPIEKAIPVDSKCGGVVKVFMDVIKPLPRLIIVGSGHIAKPLADLAGKVGFEIVVVDDAETATRERFPMATELRNGPFRDEMKNLKIRPSDYVAIVHGETLYELEALRTVLRGRPAYVGLLGSVNKANHHKKQLMEEGFIREEVESICTPIGLPIGAETPEEIAVSIVAELIKKRHS